MVNVVLKQTSSGSVIQEMNDSADKDYLAHVLLTDFKKELDFDRESFPSLDENGEWI